MSADLLCPECRRALDADNVCAGGHRYATRDGVLTLLAAAHAARLEVFRAALRDYRQRDGKRLLDPAVYDGLPESAAGEFFEWRLRVYDLEIVETLLAGRRRASVLDVGAYNGWLSHRLARAGHAVTAVDVFDDPYDGLRARRFYTRADWRAIQLDVRDLTVLNRVYDVVVLNRCLQFAGDPIAYLDHARARVAAGGLLVATGLDFFAWPGRRRRAIARRQAAYRARYGLDFFLTPTRGYLDARDRRRLAAAGLAIRPYPRLRRANLLARLLPFRPYFAYGIWEENPP